MALTAAKQLVWMLQGSGVNRSSVLAVALSTDADHHMWRMHCSHAVFLQDTLKRVIRAGDGTILATSPPYTRCFKSNVDFAVVSAGVPSADAWVQEFLTHRIPCISADYLVEYVCKPGHDLAKHLAEKSLEKLLKNQHGGITTKEEAADEADVVCATCGSNDRDRPMLVCGSDRRSSAAGCGVVVHVDCCDPPVESAPAGEWVAVYQVRGTKTCKEEG